MEVQNSVEATENKTMKTKRESVLVFKGAITRQLLRDGYTIVDIKPDKNNKDRTVHVFRNVPGLEDRISELAAIEREKKKSRSLETK